MSGTGKIADLVKRFEALSSTEFRQRLLGKMAVEVHRLTLQGFVQQRDPDGKPWAPRKKAADWVIRAFGLMQDNHPILDTGRRDGAVNRLTVRSTNDGVRLTTNKYMKFHLTGTYKMVPRKWIPTTELGPIWRNALQTVYTDSIRSLLK